jgi:shikimate 5-dehydrogenase
MIVTNRSTAAAGRDPSLPPADRRGSPIEYHHTPTPDLTDRIMAGLKAGSLVVNATGLGKDAPGSPLTDAAPWPQDGLAWDFNYRGDLVFLRQARSRQQAKNLQIEDGWIYFIHGWTRVIAEVFHIDIPDQRAAI